MEKNYNIKIHETLTIDDKDELIKIMKRKDKSFELAEKIANVGYWEYDQLLDKVSWSKQMFVIYGIDIDLTANLEEIFNLIHPDDRKRVYETFSLSNEAKTPYEIEYRIVRPNGEVRYVVENTEYFSDVNEWLGTIGSIHDITEHNNLRIRLIEEEQYYKSLFENNTDAVYSFDLQGNFLSCNAALEDMFGYSKEELLKGNYDHLIEPGSLQKNRDFFMATITTLSPQNYDTTCIRRNRGIIELNVTNLPIIINKELIGVYGIAKNITEKKALEQSLVDLAYHDYLTDLPNRRMFEEQLNKQLRLAQSYNKKIALLLIDVDRFKSVNDTLGHSIGDALLKQLANKLQNCLGEDQIIYRLGGDEFCIVLLEVESHSEVMSLSDKIMQIIKEEFLIEGFELNITASVGISLSPEDGITVESLFKHADTALYFSKSQGRDQAQWYTPSLNVQSFKLFALSNDLRKALEKNELFLLYMPRVDAQTTQILGAEALIRWNHPDWGLVSPAEFIPIAEETGLIIPIGEWVLREACKQIKQWEDMELPPMIISVNFSVQQLLKQNILQTIDQIVEESGISPERLEVEITESSFISNEKEVTQLLADLKKRKIKVSLDDFGTGYSSLYLLKRLALDTLKIDKSFVDEILTDHVSKSILECILDLAKALGMNVVAEGVETAEQYKFFKERKCNEIQGYYFSPPINPDEFVHLLNNKQLTNQSLKTKQEKLIANCRECVGPNLRNSLVAGMTIVMFNGQKVDLGSTEVLITNIGPSGLVFLMGVRLPVNDDIVLKFETEILNQAYELHGNIAWINEIEVGVVYEYGVQFQIEENILLKLSENLNILAFQIEGVPSHTHLFVGDPVSRIKEQKKKKIIKVDPKR